jgi:predicted nucleic acid-binding protein
MVKCPICQTLQSTQYDALYLQTGQLTGIKLITVDAILNAREII